MSTQQENLTAIADAIREKEGTTDPIPALEFPARIRAIQTGSEFSVPLVVTAEAGAVITAVQGETALTATSDGSATLLLTSPGDWEVSAVLGEKRRGPKTVTVENGYTEAFSFVESRLPEGYTEVAYIESEGTNKPYIKTGVIADYVNKIVMDAEPLDDSATSAFFFGMYSISTSYSPRIDINWDLTTGVIYGWLGNLNTKNPVTKALQWTGQQRKRMTVISDYENGTITVDGATQSVVNKSRTSSAELYLLAQHYVVSSSKIDQAQYVSSWRLYSCQIESQYTWAARNFVPCINSEGAAGLYDLVNNKFYESPSTPFKAGPAL